MLITLTPGDTATQIEEGGSSHTEQSATPHTWWGRPLESVGATF